MLDVLQCTGQSSTQRAGPNPAPERGLFPDPDPGFPAAAQKPTVFVVSVNAFSRVACSQFSGSWPAFLFNGMK